MSTAPHWHPADQPYDAAVPPSSSPPEPAPDDPTLVQQTQHQIRQLVLEITRLSRAEISQQDFYHNFLNRVVSALASIGGAIWTVNEDGGLELQYHINLTKTQLVEDPQRRGRHGRLLKRVLDSGQPLLVPPQSGTTHAKDAGNPTDFLLVLGTLRVESQVLGIVEIFQRPGAGPTTQRGYLRFLVQMCQLASDYLKNCRLRQFNDQQLLWRQLEQLISALHRGLDPRITAYTIANEGRRFIQCDRASVVLCRGRGCRVEAVSGLDSIERRAEQLRLLKQLAQRVLATGQALWYSGPTAELPPQIEEPLQQYVDRAHCRQLAILPLQRPLEQDEAARRAQRSQPIGALVVEQHHDGSAGPALKQRAEVVAQHGGAAMANALEHDNLFLLPLWRLLGRATAMLRLRTLPMTISVAAALLAAIVALLVVPADFRVAAQGQLQPSTRRDIFVRVDGVVAEVLVGHAQQVQPGQVLAEMRSTNLEVDISRLVGQQVTTQEQIRSKEKVLLKNTRLTPVDQDRIHGELLQLAQQAENTRQQLQLYRQKEQYLTLRSPMGGQVVTWQVSDTLLQRPVQRGQVLMTVVDPAGDWELELYVPERKMGHLARARRQSDEPLPVTFMLSTHPGQPFEGRVVEVHHSAETRVDKGPSVLVRVAIDKQQLPELRCGTSVQAHVACGRRSVGYVWFHELIETVQSQILFWL